MVAAGKRLEMRRQLKSFLSPMIRFAAFAEGCWNKAPYGALQVQSNERKEGLMGRSILLWLLGVPIPIIVLLWFFWH
jgi:hypothetical protein